MPWVHLDIAGPARANADDGYLAKGGTGFGVRTLVELARTLRAADRGARDHHGEGEAAGQRSTRTMNAARRGRAATVGLALVVATLAFVVPAPAAARVPASTTW